MPLANVTADEIETLEALRAGTAYVHPAPGSAAAPALCEDEGCPQHGKPHVCTDSSRDTVNTQSRCDDEARRQAFDAGAESMYDSLSAETKSDDYPPNLPYCDPSLNKAFSAGYRLGRVSGREAALSAGITSEMIHDAPHETEAAMLARLGTDGPAWAREFTRHWMHCPDKDLVGFSLRWFVEAIQAGRTLGYEEGYRAIVKERQALKADAYNAGYREGAADAREAASVRVLNVLFPDNAKTEG